MEETTKTYGFTGNLAAKVGAFILAVILFVLTVGGCLGAFAKVLENDFDTVPEEQAVESVLGSAVTSYQYEFGRTDDSYLENEEDESNYRYGVSEMRRVHEEHEHNRRFHKRRRRRTPLQLLRRRRDDALQEPVGIRLLLRDDGRLSGQLVQC